MVFQQHARGSWNKTAMDDSDYDSDDDDDYDEDEYDDWWSRDETTNVWWRFDG